MTEIINIGSCREVFWDDYIVDAEKSTSTKELHHPIRRDMVLSFDMPWEGDGCDYQNFFRDADGTYRLYYLGWRMINEDGTQHTNTGIRVCYAESRDGLHWVKPNLGICEFDGSRDNNIILDINTNFFDNFMVMRDENPQCTPDELYKGIGSCGGALWCFTSADAIHFKKAWMMTDRGCFDSLNTVLWDKYRGIYIAYIRGFHTDKGDGSYEGIRDIRYIVSKDFHEWSDPVFLDFKGGDDYPLYTNCVSKYYRADHIFTGFPTRYVQREKWNDSFERLCGREKRLARMKLEPRFGLAITDCVFMSSRDGFTWDRTEEAYMRPGPEESHNWLYGDCYPTLGMVETEGVYPGTDNELSMFAFTNHWMGIPAQLWRYTIRLDGFISRHATYKPQTLVTKPFIYDGGELHINFETSAIGGIYIKLTADDGRSIVTDEIFGDSTDRTAGFTDGSPSDFAGRPVVMEITMRDADIYSFIFK